MVQIKELIQYCKLLKYLRTSEYRVHRVAYKHRILSTDNIETIFGPGDVEWYKVYTDRRCNKYYVSEEQVNSIKL